ncbi:MAG TPA: hypothetical protein VK907_09120 [Phnomibacter sp.]|nr:hypothetical protein [Phnomibacter sp.]
MTRYQIHKYIFQGLFLCLLSCIGVGARAQGFYFYNDGYYEPGWLLEASLNAGIMNCITDIGGNKEGKQGLGATTLKNTKPLYGITVSSTYKDVVAFRIDINRGMIEAHDSLLKGATHYSAIGRYERNLNFRTPITEVMVGAELHPLFLRDYQIKDRYMPRISPFITVGGGWVFFNPQALVGDQWIDLHPLRLEGQGFEEYPDRKIYSKSSALVVGGVGFRYEVSRLLSLRLEGQWRYTFTDYLDDVSEGDWVDPSLFFKYLPTSEAILASQLYNRSPTINPPRNTRPRGNIKDKDVYWSVNFRIGFALNRARR